MRLDGAAKVITVGCDNAGLNVLREALNLVNMVHETIMRQIISSRKTLYRGYISGTGTRI